MLFSKMNYLLTAFQILLTYSLFVTGQTECSPDPCESTECPRYLNAECIGNTEDCTAKFFWRDRDVTEQCDVRTCDTRRCGNKRDCMEKVFPPSCPQDRSNCRQYIRTSCMLRPPSRPLSCDDIKCDDGLMCRFRERVEGFSPVVRCVPFVPKDCSELVCDEGFTCIQRGRRPVCSTIVTTPTPTNCSEVNCKPDEICLVTSGTPTCTSLTFECSEVECEDDEICVLESITMRPTCVSVTPTTTTTTTTPIFTAESCDQLDCLSFSTVCNQLTETLAVCEPPTECSDEFNESCNEIGLVCGPASAGFNFVSCVIPSNCDQVTCNQNESCILNLFGNVSIARCVPDTVPMFGLQCEDLRCPIGQRWFFSNYPSINISVAICVGDDALGVILQNQLFTNQTCSTINCLENVCVDIQLSATQFLPSCIPQMCSNDLVCQESEVLECLSLASLNLDSAPDSICTPRELQSMISSESCDENERICREGTVCQNAYINGTLIGTLCNLPANFGRTCDEVQCIAENSGCVVRSIPSMPEVPQQASCIPNFDAITMSLFQVLRARGLIE